MSKTSLAQDQLLVLDPSSVSPLEVALPVDADYGTHPDQEHELSGHPSLEVHDPGQMEIMVEELPGAPSGTKDPEPLEVVDTAPQVEDHADDANDAKKAKNEKWDWAAKGPHGFVAWVQERLAAIPKHSGYDSAGLERAMAYLDRLDNEISRAMRMDLDGELDANKVEEVRSKLDEGVSRLQARLDKVKDSKKSSRKKKKSTSSEEFTSDTLIKEAQKILGVQGVYIMAPLLISGLARICVNGTVSAGHDIEDLYARQVEQWKLTAREQFELRQLLFDMGFVVRADRGALPDEDYDVASSDNMDWAANYKG